MTKILVAEDEHAIRSFIVINLKRAGFEVVEAENGRIALEQFKQQTFDILLLDIMMPEVDGFQVCEQARAADEVVGIIMLTARTREEDKVMGLSVGADDYIAKPFSPAELVARIQSLLRRVETLRDRKQPKELHSGPFRIDLGAKRVQKDGHPIEVTPTEYDLLCHFIRNEDQVMSRDELLDAVWGENYFGDRKTVDVNIRRLRQKIEDNPAEPRYIETLWGHGYKWRGEQ
ncbi:response regulator transcription factor [Exiguobacterium flavidum]|uniref:response regulator transcription factor n=1 Tax=Exiguobacterium flavidum TaxID=2184695 RepID=UPI000DF7DF2E|nr:response regulator transcription factor [Exiguobacterium flavidum]